MYEDIFEIIKKKHEPDDPFTNHPCKTCSSRSTCNQDQRGTHCAKWVSWFKEEWGKIRTTFGMNENKECDLV